MLHSPKLPSLRWHQGKAGSDFPTGRASLNEARAVNLISHLAIVQISDHGQLPDGRLYLVMELLRGVTLSDRLKQCGERLPEAEVLRHGWTLVGALCAAHEQDIVHRDIKPSNSCWCQMWTCPAVSGSRF